MLKLSFHLDLFRVDQMIALARINDAESVDVPADGVAGLAHPPIVIIAEPNDTPIES